MFHNIFKSENILLFLDWLYINFLFEIYKYNRFVSKTSYEKKKEITDIHK